MSKITHAILLWDGRDSFLDEVNFALRHVDLDRKQKFGLLTDFETKEYWQYGLAKAGGTKAFVISTAAAAFNMLTEAQIQLAVGWAFSSTDENERSHVILLTIPEERAPTLKTWGGLYQRD
jgi:hypothetical protein